MLLLHMQMQSFPPHLGQVSILKYGRLLCAAGALEDCRTANQPQGHESRGQETLQRRNGYANQQFYCCNKYWDFFFKY